MNSDFRVSVDFFSHHKTRKLKKRLGAPALVSLLQLWAYAALRRTDGDFSGMTEEDMELAAGWEGEEGVFVAALLEIGFMEHAENGVRLHHWAENNPWAAEEKARRERSQKAANARWGNAAEKTRQTGPGRPSPRDGARDMPEECAGLGDASPGHPSGNAPMPMPFKKNIPPLTSFGGVSPAAQAPPARTPETDGPVHGAAKKRACPPCPQGEILAAYHEDLPELPRMKSWGDDRQRNLRARWRERRNAGKYAAQSDGIQYFRKLFRYIRDSDWLMGRKPGRDGRCFFASLDWIVRPGNFAKIIDGFYHEREAA